MLLRSSPSQRDYCRAVSRMGWSMLLFIGLFYAINIPAEILAQSSATLSDPRLRGLLTVVSGVVSTLAYMAPFIGAGVFYLLLSKKAVTQRIRLELTMPPQFPLLVLAGLAIITVGSYINAYFCTFIGFIQAQESVPAINYTNPANVINYMTTAIAPAFAEEFLFRGVYYSNLRPYGRTQAVLISALLFALMHQNPAQIIYTFVAGVVMAMMYELTGSIWCSIIFHLLNNELAVMTEILINGKYGEGAYRGLYALDLVEVVLGISALILLLVLYRNRLPKRHRRSPRGARLYKEGREVPSEEGSVSMGYRAASPLSSWRALFTPGMIVFASVVTGFMTIEWIAVLIKNAVGG